MNDSDLIKTASLENPFYYLENAQTIWRWVLQHHRDCLSHEEVVNLQAIISLPKEAKALLVRLNMRKGELFCLSDLNYTEIRALETATTLLSEAKLIEIDPHVSFDEATNKLNKDFLWAYCQTRLTNAPKKNTRKAELVVLLKQLTQSDRLQRFSDWGDNRTWLKLTDRSFFKRIQLMFFGNLHQDWSEFIITELGLIHYEAISYSATLRAFKSREDITNYLQLDSVLDQLELTSTESTLTLDDSLLSTNPSRWLEAKRKKVCFRAAQTLEKRGQFTQAMKAYKSIGSNEANIRLLRIMEKQCHPKNTIALAEDLLNVTVHGETRTLIYRILKRQYKKVGGATLSLPSIIHITEKEITFSNAPQSVEKAVATFLTETNSPVYYIENRLIPALWGLLYWEAIYAPIKGAFFHPFQAAPADLYSQDFLAVRKHYVDSLESSLNEDTYKQVILENYHAKHGLRCPFVYWPVLSVEMIEQALDSISKEQIKGIFKYLEQDLRQHKKGLPDLIQFNLVTNTTAFIEVKAPNDRLQIQQQLWLEQLIKLGFDCCVAKVRWLS